MTDYVKSKSYLYFYNLFQLAELIKKRSISEEEGNDKGKDRGGNAADGHVEHQDKGIDGAHPTKEDTTQQQRHRGQAEHGEIGNGG